jgi:hypothetical protein
VVAQPFPKVIQWLHYFRNQLNPQAGSSLPDLLSHHSVTHPCDPIAGSHICYPPTHGLALPCLRLVQSFKLSCLPASPLVPASIFHLLHGSSRMQGDGAPQSTDQGPIPVSTSASLCDTMPVTLSASLSFPPAKIPFQDLWKDLRGRVFILLI